MISDAIRLEIPLITFTASLTYGQRYCAVRVEFLYPRHNGTDFIITVGEVLSSLQNDRAEIKCISPVSAFKDLFPRKMVSVYPGIFTAKSAVKTVVPTDIREFNKTSKINIFAVYPVSLRSCQTVQIIPVLPGYGLSHSQ